MGILSNKELERVLPVVTEEGLIIAPNGNLFDIPFYIHGKRDREELRQGRCRAISPSTGKMFPEVISDCWFKDDQLIRLVQYKKVGSKSIKCLDCDMQDGRVLGNFFMRSCGEEYNGNIGSDGAFTGWRRSAYEKKWYINGLCHGTSLGIGLCCGEDTYFKHTYDHGVLNGAFCVWNNSFYRYGYIKDGNTLVQRELSSDDYPLLKKLKLFAVFGHLMSYHDRMIMKQSFDIRNERNRYRNYSY